MRKKQAKIVSRGGSKLLPLKSDVVFKMVFGDARYTSVIRAFLAAVLDMPQEEFEGLEIIDPHLERDGADDKLGILDVRAALRSGKLVSVEIQIRETPYMAERVTFSTGRNLSRQIAPGQGYSRIEKVVTIVIADYSRSTLLESKFTMSISQCLACF